MIRYKRALQMRIMSHLRKTSDGTWEVRIVVPPDARAVIGKNNLTKRLGRITASEANRRALPVIQAFQDQIAAARAGGVPHVPPTGTADSFESKIWGKVAIHPVGWNPSQPARSMPVAAPLSEMFEGYAKERDLAPATRKRWRPVIDSMIAHIGHDNAALITADDVVAWKEALLLERAQRTVREVYLAALKATLTWGVANRRLPTNPATGLSVRVPKKIKNRGKGFTPDEARAILRAASSAPNKRISAHYQRARRWIPWVCAYTGARVGEISQLRGCDVFRVGDVPVVRITPEAGSTKTHSSRLVPLHQHLIEQGFVEAVEAVGDGPLFYDPTLARGGKTANPQHKKCVSVVRTFGTGRGVN